MVSALFLELLLLSCWISWTHPLVFFSSFSTPCFLLYFLGVPSTILSILFSSFHFWYVFQHPGIIFISKHYHRFFFYRRNVFPEDSVRFSFNCTTCFLQVAFLFILNILMLNTVLTRLLVCSYLKARGWVDQSFKRGMKLTQGLWASLPKWSGQYSVCIFKSFCFA